MKLPAFRSPGPTLWGIGVFLIILAVSAPWIPVFLLTLFIGLLISATLAYSLNLITGLTGYVSFGHVVFMAFGGYALAFGVGTLKLPPVAGVGLAALVGLALALGIGAVTLRFRGVFFAIATLVVAVAALYIVLEITELGDGQGISLNVGFEPLSMFYTIWGILAIEIGLTFWITRGRIGYGIRSIKCDEDAANMLEVSQVHKYFGGVRAVEGVSLTLEEGRVIGLIGPNGSGKSTLCNLIAGVERPTKGTITFAGQRIDRWPAHRVVEQGIAKTHQIPKPFLAMTCRENVAVAAMFGSNKQKDLPEALETAGRVLALVGLEAKVDGISSNLTVQER